VHCLPNFTFYLALRKKTVVEKKYSWGKKKLLTNIPSWHRNSFLWEPLYLVIAALTLDGHCRREVSGMMLGDQYVDFA